MKKALAVLALVAATVSGAALGQPYPSKPIRVVVPYPPGGGTDLLARSIAPRLSDKEGQSIAVDNRSGANGMIGGEIVAKSPPDGYTLLLATSAEVALNAAVYEKMPYNPEREFAPIMLLANSPLVLAVHPALPAKNVKEFIALAKKRPGEITYGSGGAGGPHHIAGEWMKLLAKIDIIHVPYRGGGPLIVDLMGGHLHTSIIALPVVAPYVKAGKVRALAVTSAKRSAALPEVPTLDESGLRGLDVSQWWGVLGPAGLPREIISKLNSDLGEIVKLPATRTRMAELGMEPVGSSPAQLGELIHTDITKYRKVVKEAKIRID
ncbi:MAG TPA: tripartite tricarboxylate transporter substrate binding protein [Burkholderiales bacterium]|nr:tripartite tricarboxylate transporter substrate binding protein [Burkholderiales bacterium]